MAATTLTDVPDNIVREFNKMKLGNVDSPRFLVFSLLSNYENGCQLEIAQRGDFDSTWDNLVVALPLNEPRYAVYRVDPSQTIVFVLWVPEISRIREQMLYCSWYVQLEYLVSLKTH